IYKYIKTDGIENYDLFKNQLIDEFNSLNIPGMTKIEDLYAVNGSYVNIAYPMPSGYEVQLLDDKEIYLCNQVECEFNDGEPIKCFCLVAGINFLLVS
ncbi:MAG: DNA-binding protein, partial [Clostridia bacterium]|nr:DNA-binding protein [Clostridia bacterium]